MPAPRHPRLLVSALLAACFASLLHAIPSGGVFNNYELIWNETFDYRDASGARALDPQNWNIRDSDTYPDARGALDKASAVQIVTEGSNPVLRLSVYTNPADGAIHAGRVTTRQKFQQAYGYYEARIRWDKLTGGVCGAFWLMPSSTPFPNPASGVEIDIVEMRKERKGGYYTDGPGTGSTTIDTTDTMNVGVHWDGYGGNQNSLWKDVYPRGHGNRLDDGQFHVYGLLWTPDEYVIYFDDVEVLRFPRVNAPDAVPGVPLANQGIDNPATPGVNEGWRSTDKNGTILADWYYPKTGLTQSNIKVAYDKAISQALEYLFLSAEVRDPANAGQANWVGDLPAGGFGPLGHANNFRMSVDWVRVYRPTTTTTPFAANTVPGVILAENFDNGGIGHAYFDMPGTGPGTDTAYRPGQSVDIFSFGGGNRYVANTAMREWLAYTISPQSAGVYAVFIDAGNPNSASGGSPASINTSIDGFGLGTVRIDGSTGSGAAVIRRTLAPSLAFLDAAPAVLSVEFMNNAEAWFDGAEFVRLGASGTLRHAGQATRSGSVLVNLTDSDPFLYGFSGAGSALFANMPGWQGGAAKLSLRYSGVWQATKQASIKVRINGQFLAAPGGGDLVLPLTLPAPDFVSSGNQQFNYKLLTVDLPAGALAAGDNNTVELVSTAGGRDTRINWIALTSEVAPPSASTTLVNDNFTAGSTTGWSTSHERLTDATTGATLAVANGGIAGNALRFGSTANFKSALRAFNSTTLAVGDSLTLSFDYRFASAPWNNASGLWVGLANSAQTVLRDTAQPDTSGNRTYAAFYATANPAGQAGGSYLKINQGSGATATNLGSAYGTAASGTTARSVEMTFTRTAAGTLRITSNLGRFGLSPATVTETTTTGWFTFDRLFVVKGASSLNIDLFIDNVSIVHTPAP